MKKLLLLSFCLLASNLQASTDDGDALLKKKSTRTNALAERIGIATASLILPGGACAGLGYLAKKSSDSLQRVKAREAQAHAEGKEYIEYGYFKRSRHTNGTKIKMRWYFEEPANADYIIHYAGTISRLKFCLRTHTILRSVFSGVFGLVALAGLGVAVAPEEQQTKRVD